jgi:hypothetical protein
VFVSQWRQLESWAEKHPGLHQVLTPDRILFGEWFVAHHRTRTRTTAHMFVCSCRVFGAKPKVVRGRLYARHSIHYTNLPDLFLAFDIYDKKKGTLLGYFQFYL